MGLVKLAMKLVSKKGAYNVADQFLRTGMGKGSVDAVVKANPKVIESLDKIFKTKNLKNNSIANYLENLEIYGKRIKRGTIKSPIKGIIMPWQYPDNIPSSIQHFKPEIQVKAISIANAILKSGGSESVAIATGIKKAKQMSKGGLLKVAGILTKIKDFATPARIVPTVIGGSLGALIGRATSIDTDKRGYAKHNKDGSVKLKPTALKRTLIGAAIGGGVGLKMGHTLQKDITWQKQRRQQHEQQHEQWKREFSEKYGYNHETGEFNKEHKYWKEFDKNFKFEDDFFDDFFKNGGRRSGFHAPKPPTTHNQFFETHKLNPSDFKTKKDLKSTYRKLAPKYHPDTGGTSDGFKRFQKEWEDVEGSEYFNKLAGLVKQAFESGAHSNLPNAWKTMGKGVGQGQRQDIPLAKGLPKVKPLNFKVQL